MRARNCPNQGGPLSSDPYGEGIVSCAHCGQEYHALCAPVFARSGCAKCGQPLQAVGVTRASPARVSESPIRFWRQPRVPSPAPPAPVLSQPPPVTLPRPAPTVPASLSRTGTGARVFVTVVILLIIIIAITSVIGKLNQQGATSVVSPLPPPPLFEGSLSMSSGVTARE